MARTTHAVFGSYLAVLLLLVINLLGYGVQSEVRVASLRTSGDCSCSTCINIPGVGCIDLSDPALRPQAHEEVSSNARVASGAGVIGLRTTTTDDCSCSTCISVSGVGCIDLSDGGLHPQSYEEVPSKSRVAADDGDCTCPTCIRFPGVGCVHTDDPGLGPRYRQYKEDCDCKQCIWFDFCGCLVYDDNDQHQHQQPERAVDQQDQQDS